MSEQGRRSYKIGIITLLITLVGWVLLGLAIRAGWIDAEASTRPIQDQGSSPYCLFAVTAYLYGGDMWELEADYQRRNLPLIGRAPSARPVIDLARKQAPITIGTQWDTATVEAVVQQRPVAVTGQGHALVLIGWHAGTVTYLDSLRSGELHTMRDQEFWAWWDGWSWWGTP